MPREMVTAVPSIRADPLAYLERTVDRFGDLVAFPLPRTPVLLVNTPAGAQRVLVENHRAYSKRTVQYGALSMVTGAGLLTSDGSTWRAARRTAQPAFHHGGLEVVARESAVAAERLRAAHRHGDVVDVEAACLDASMSVVGRTLFGADLDDSGAALVRAVLAALDVVVSRARSPVPVPAWVPTPGNGALRRANRALDEACARVVTSRRRSSGQRPAGGDDLLGLLLQAADSGGLSPRQVRDELVTMVIAGHETVASSLAWTLHLLAQHPSAQSAVLHELDEVLAGRAPGWADLPLLRRTRAVVDESLRLYPPAWVLSRRALSADEVDGVPVPAGTLVVLSPWLLHRRADVFADPSSFVPERFLPAGDGGRPGPAALSADGRRAYLPFGAGPRLCIGRDFALVESVLVLAGLLRDRSVAPVPGAVVRVDASVTLRPRGGLPLRVLPR